jgi:iron complex transport system ATP-binding protein
MSTVHMNPAPIDEPQADIDWAPLSLDRVRAGYRDSKGTERALVGPETLQLAPGDLICLLGPNGAGKSTLLRTMSGMQPPLSGVVSIGGKNVAALSSRHIARQLAVVLTERVGAGLMTVYDLVSLGRHPFTDWTGRLQSHDHAVVQASMRTAGVEGLADRLVDELSDGERQKVMVAKALAQEPAVMILDEITAFLDLPRRIEIMQTLRTLAHDHGRAILLSTHDLDLAVHTADALWLLKEGRLLKGMPEELVLDGTFASVFENDTVLFDRHSGTFRMRRRGRGRAVVLGDGISARWTRNAFERVGFDVADRPDSNVDVAFEVEEAGTGTVWKESRQGNAVAAHATLTQAVEALRRGRGAVAVERA